MGHCLVLEVEIRCRWGKRHLKYVNSSSHGAAASCQVYVVALRGADVSDL